VVGPIVTLEQEVEIEEIVGSEHWSGVLLGEIDRHPPALFLNAYGHEE